MEARKLKPLWMSVFHTMGDTTIQREEKKNPPPALAEHNESSTNRNSNSQI